MFAGHNDRFARGTSWVFVGWTKRVARRVQHPGLQGPCLKRQFVGEIMLLWVVVVGGKGGTHNELVD